MKKFVVPLELSLPSSVADWGCHWMADLFDFWPCSLVFPEHVFERLCHVVFFVSFYPLDYDHPLFILLI